MKNRRNILALYVAAFIILLIFVGTAILLYYSRNKNSEGETQKRIGAVYMTMNNPYFEVVNEKIKAVVRSKGDVIMTRDSALDAEMQNRQIEEFIEDGVDILLVNAVDWKGVQSALTAAKEAGIPVLAVDAEVYDDSLVDATVVSDNYSAGVLCAEDLMSRRDSGRILFLIQDANKSAVDRIQGFQDTLDNAGWEYDIVAELECQGQLEIAQPLVEEVLEETHDIDVVMGLNDPSALGAMAALDAAGMLSDVLVYGVDGAPEAKTMIYEKRMTATAAQFPMQVATVASELLYELLDGQETEKKTVISVELITQENVSAYNLSGWQ